MTLPNDEYLIIKLTPAEIEHILNTFDMCGSAELDPEYGTDLEDRINDELTNALRNYTNKTETEVINTIASVFSSVIK